MTVKTTPTDKMANALAKAPEQVSITDLIQKSTKEIGKALPAHLTPERMTRIALTCVRLNPELSQCTPASFMGALFTLAALGLEPLNGNAYLLPFTARKKVGSEWRSEKNVTAVIGFKGYAQLFYRGENSISLDVQVAYENDEFSYELGSNPFVKHKPTLKNKGEPVAVYAVAKLKGGGTVIKVMSYEECLEHGKAHSKTFDKKDGKFYSSSPWATEPEQMSKKTVVIQIAKLLPLSFEMQRAISADETSRDYRSGIDDVLDFPVTTTWKEVDEEGVKNAPETSKTGPGPILTTERAQPPEPGSFEDFGSGK